MKEKLSEQCQEDFRRFYEIYPWTPQRVRRVGFTITLGVAMLCAIALALGYFG